MVKHVLIFTAIILEIWVNSIAIIARADPKEPFNIIALGFDLDGNILHIPTSVVLYNKASNGERELIISAEEFS